MFRFGILECWSEKIQTKKMENSFLLKLKKKFKDSKYEISYLVLIYCNLDLK